MIFEEYRNLLFSVAYRVLGSAADAEDAVQDAWVRWSSADRSQVAEPKAYLVRIVTNVAMDRLRSASRQRETYVGPWLPEPILTDAAGPDSDTVSMALLVVLESLTPLERAVFVLREAFAFSYGEIAEAVERSEATVRQAAHRARSHVEARRPRFAELAERTTEHSRAGRVRQREVTERFFTAAGGGDINTLMELLAPDVTLWTDGGGKVRQAMRPVIGAERVATWFAGISSRPYQGVLPADMTVEVVNLNGGPGIVFSDGDRVIATLTLDLDEQGRVVAIHNVANPDKLRAVATRTVHDMGS